MNHKKELLRSLWVDLVKEPHFSRAFATSPTFGLQGLG